VVKPVVDIVTSGPGGSVVYREGEHEQAFGWDLGTGDVIATIYVPSPADWDARIPWAAGRRGEVVATLAREVSRQKCRGCIVDLSEHWIHLRERPPLATRALSAWRRFLGSFRESG
jgi:hypothetical protein